MKPAKNYCQIEYQWQFEIVEFGEFCWHQQPPKLEFSSSSGRNMGEC